MFWAEKKATVELAKKNLFIAEFTNTGNGGSKWLGTQLESGIKFIVKKIDSPSMNISVEKAYAANFVHFFHQGELHWEPINVTFVDAIDSTNTQIPQWKDMFFNYLKAAPLTYQNRTAVLDSPIFCEKIKITTYQSIAIDQPLTDSPKHQSNLFQSDWYIFRPRISRISFGTFDYASDEANDITITFVPEWCDVSETPI